VNKSDNAPQVSASAMAPRWKRSPSITLVHQLNEYCLGLLAGLAAAQIAPEYPLVIENRDLWARLNSEARGRAARLPFVILDLHFASEAWWRRATGGAEAGNFEPGLGHGLPPEMSERLVHETRKRLIWAH